MTIRPDSLDQLLPGSTIAPFADEDLAELVVVQRCCWVSEAIANDSLAVPPLHESAEEVAEWAHEWSTYVVRSGSRLVAAMRFRAVCEVCEIGRLMVVPDLAGRGIGSALLRLAEEAAPAETVEYELFTGAESTRNIAMYERAGYEIARRTAGLVFLRKPRP